MKVFISADMEGITGVAAAEDVVKGEPKYERGVDMLHGYCRRRRDRGGSDRGFAAG